MSSGNIKSTGRLTSSLCAVGALVRDALMTSEASDFCCGVRLERRRPQEEMPTPGSCCGVRF